MSYRQIVASAAVSALWMGYGEEGGERRGELRHRAQDTGTRRKDPEN
jgi:hypothetical protein